jgi:hypothetical protein
MTVYMVVERFKDGRAREVYERFRAQGRLAPEGLEYIDSWVSSDVRRCYQLMRTDDARLLEQWAAQWQDLVDFEFVPVITGREAAVKVLGD